MKANRTFTFGVLTLACGASLFGFAEGAVVMNQIGDANLYNVAAINDGKNSASQIFTDLVGFDCMVIDDFAVTGTELSISNVAAMVYAPGMFAALQGVAGYRLSIFSSSAMATTSLLGDVDTVVVMAGSGASVIPVKDAYHGLVSLNVNISLPAAGIYWVGISPVAAYNTGQFYVQHGGAQGMIVPGNGNGMFANPGDGFGVGALTAENVDYAYAITAVPEPSALMLWLLGACGLLGRRHRPGQADDNG